MLTGNQRIKILENNGWELLPTQGKIMGADVRKIFLAGGRGYGKSLSAGLFLFAESLRNPDFPKRRTYWIAAHQFDLTQYIFEYVLGEYYKLFGDDWRAFAKEKPSLPKRDCWTLKLTNNVVIETRSWGNPESLHQKKIHGLVIDEMGLLDEWTWEMRLVPSVAKTPDSWILVVGTWEETGVLQKELYERWQAEEGAVAFCAPTWENHYEYPGGRYDPTIVAFEKEMSVEAFEERFAAIPRKPARLVYPELSPSLHYGAYEYTPGEAVNLWVDPGTQCYAVLAVQEMGNDDFKVIDEIYEEGYSTEGIKEIAANREWAKDISGGGIDDKAKEAQLLWNSKKVGGFSVYLRKRPVPIDAGIERVKTYLHSRIYSEGAENIFEFRGVRGVPKIFFDSRCRNTLKEFRNYKWPKTTPRVGEPRRPIKKHDHAMNALAYGLVDAVGFVPRMRRKPTRRRDKYAHM